MRTKATIGAFCIILLAFSSLQLNAQNWKVYDGSILPAATEDAGGDTLDISNRADDSPGAGLVMEIIDDVDITGNKIFKYLHPDGKLTFRHYFDDAYADTTFTIMARIKGENDAAYDRVFDIRWDNGNDGTRDELRIWAQDSSIELEKAGVTVKVDMDLYGWHTYRIVINGDYASVYIDENPVAVVEGTTTATSSNKYIKIGDGSGDAIGGYLDWFTLNTTGAFAPGEGDALPEGLYVDGAEVPVEPMWKVYDASVLPAETDGFTGALLDISNEADNSPGAGMIREIIDDTMILGNKVLKYLHPDGKLTFRHYFDDDYTGTAFTIMARIKAENDTTYDRAMDIRWDNGNNGTRDELRIWAKDSTIELEKADFKVQVDMDLYQWHTYRITVSGDFATVYIDENPVAVVEGITTASSSNKYMKVGDGSGDAIGGYIDWLTMDMSGAYAPGEGIELPAELYVDGTAEPNEPLWQVYDGSVLPEATDGFSGGLLDISNQADNSPGDGMVKEIIDDSMIPGNKVLKYLQPDGKLTFRYYFPDEYEGTAFTMMTRIKAENDTTYDRAMDIRWDNGNNGTRDELRIWAKDSTIELEKADVKVKVDMDLYQWHTYRIVVDGDFSTVYINEEMVAVVEGTTTATSSNKYIKIGDGSGDAIGGYIDWFTLDVSGAYDPGEGIELPSELYIDGNPLPPTPMWQVYDASIMPEETADLGEGFLDISNVADDSPGDGLISEIMDDPDITGNKFLKYLNPDGKRTYRHYFADDYADSAFTIMVRIAAENDSVYDRAMDIRWDNGNAGTRDELRIWPADSTLELEKADLKIKLDVDLYKWHTYRIVVDGDHAAVYLDENEEPVVQGTTTASSSSKYLKIGDGSGDNIGGYVDWCILDVSGAYAPGQGLAVPEGLKVDLGPQPVVPKWLVYDASMIPQDTEGAGGDTLAFTDLSQDSPGDGFVEEIIDDADIDGNKLLKFLAPNGTRMYRYMFAEDYADSAFTMMTRIKGESEGDYDRAFDIQWRNGNANSRDQLRISPADSTLELDRSDAEVKVDMDLYQWHSYRIAVNGDVTSVYVDQISEPVLVGTSTETSGENYIKIGDGSGDAIGGYVDWFIVDMSGAYGEGEGLPIPEELYVDRYIAPIESMWIVYDASILPSETEGFGHDSLDISNLSSDSPGPGFVEELISDPDIEGNSILKFLMPLGSRMYRYYYPEGFAGNFTWVVRMKQEQDVDTTYDRAFDLQWRNTVGGARDELRVDAWDSTLELEKADVTVPVDMNLFAWHTYRIAVSGATTNVYVDENPEPVLTGTATESTSDSYIKFGDGGSAVNGGYLDWVAIDVSGAYSPEEGQPFPDDLFVDDYSVGVEQEQAGIPTEYLMSQNYPNPFNPSTTIKFQLPKAGNVKVSIYNTIGQLVTELVNSELDAGYHTVNFDASRYASGVYFYTIKSGDFVDVKKMMLLK